MTGVQQSTVGVPEEMSFEAAIEVTQGLLLQFQQGQIQEPALAAVIANLVATENGARGFFVVYLSSDHNVQAEALIATALRPSFPIVAPLLVKNLAMSTAMALTHQRNQRPDLRQGSERVQSRTVALIRLLDATELKTQAQGLAASIQTGHGAYQSFLDRWGYDQEQRQAIYTSLEQSGLLGAS